MADRLGDRDPALPDQHLLQRRLDAQETDEYNTLYLPTGDGTGQCGPPRTDCFPSTTAPCTLPQIVNSIDFGGSGMFQHMMDNDPRLHYFHQTNLMNVNASGEPAGEPTGTNALYYQLMDPLQAQYDTYFAANAPIVQMTMPQIGTLLREQAAWATASVSPTASVSQITTPAGPGGALPAKPQAPVMPTVSAPSSTPPSR